jgi:succinate dehydrogenase flavin-adding protein (antitoxin of CptAB toxin-antitoxin module)
MLTFNFTRLFKTRGIDKPFSYLVSHGYSDNFATRIANNRIESLRLKDLNRLCDLFHCTPNDMFQWTPGNKDTNIETHHLISLKRTDNVVHLTKLLNSVPLDKVADIENLIKKEIEK